MARISTFSVAGLALAVLAVTAGCATSPGNRDALWHIVHQDCVPAAQAGGTGKCVEVDIAQGVEAGAAVLKDLYGPLQYLLIPTARVTGIEDASLLKPGTAPYFADAWRARRWMSVRRGSAVPDDDVALAINSADARSQDQLHVHISCVRPDLKAFLKTKERAAGPSWTALAGGWKNHPYQVRRIVAESLAGEDPFQDVAQHIPGASAAMGHRGIAVVGATFADGRHGFWILEMPVDAASGSNGGIEDDVQDHACDVLTG